MIVNKINNARFLKLKELIVLTWNLLDQLYPLSKFEGLIVYFGQKLSNFFYMFKTQVFVWVHVYVRKFFFLHCI